MLPRLEGLLLLLERGILGTRLREYDFIEPDGNSGAVIVGFNGAGMGCSSYRGVYQS